VLQVPVGTRQAVRRYPRGRDEQPEVVLQQCPPHRGVGGPGLDVEIGGPRPLLNPGVIDIHPQRWHAGGVCRFLHLHRRGPADLESLPLDLRVAVEAALLNHTGKVRRVDVLVVGRCPRRVDGWRHRPWPHVPGQPGVVPVGAPLHEVRADLVGHAPGLGVRVVPRDVELHGRTGSAVRPLATRRLHAPVEALQIEVDDDGGVDCSGERHAAGWDLCPVVDVQHQITILAHTAASPRALGEPGEADGILLSQHVELDARDPPNLAADGNDRRG